MSEKRDDSPGEAPTETSSMSLERALDVAERVMAAEAAGGDIQAALEARAEGDRGAPSSPEPAPADGPPPPADGPPPPADGPPPPADGPPPPADGPPPPAEGPAPPPADGPPPPAVHDRPRTVHDRPGAFRPDDRRGRRRDGPPEVTEARKVRSPFGTRVARKIVCSVCGANDTIHFAPRADQAPLCRRCAAERLGVIDREANIAPEQREKCERCELWVKKPCLFEDPLDCPEHARAMAFRQQDRARTGTRSKKNVIRVRKKT